MNNENILSEIFSVSSHYSSKDIPELPPKKVIKNPLNFIRSTSFSPTNDSKSLRKSIKLLTHSPKFMALLSFSKKFSASSPNNEIDEELNEQIEKIEKSPNSPKNDQNLKNFMDIISAELVLRKHNKNQENYVFKQKRVFEKEFDASMSYQKALTSFNNSTGYHFKNLLDTHQKMNEKKLKELQFLNKQMKDFALKKELDATNSTVIDKNVKEMYIKMTLLKGNEDIAISFLSELKTSETTVSEKTILQEIYQDQLSNKYQLLKQEVERKERDYKEMSRLLHILSKQENQFQDKLIPINRDIGRLSSIKQGLNMDLIADRLFQEEVLEKKDLAQEKKQQELKKTILEFADLRKELLQNGKKIKEQEKEIEELDIILNEKKEAKINSSNLLNSLDYIDRISHIFIYNDPNDYDLESCKDIEKDIVENSPSGLINLVKIGRVDSQKSIRSVFSSNVSLKKNEMVEKRTFLNVLSNMTSKRQENGINISQMSVFGYKRQVFSEKNTKKAGIERIERFCMKHNNDIKGLFERILSYYQKLVIEDISMKTRIEDLNEQKVKLFDELSDLKKILYREVESNGEIADKSSLLNKKVEKSSFYHENSVKGNYIENEENTINDLKFMIVKSGDFLESLQMKDIQAFEGVLLRTLLFLQEILARFCSLTKTVFLINPIESTEDENRFREIIEDLSEKFMKFIKNQEGLEEVIKKHKKHSVQLSPKQKSALKIRKGLDNYCGVNKLTEMQQLFEKFFENPLYKDDIHHCLDIIRLDFILYNFTSIETLHSQLSSYKPSHHPMANDLLSAFDHMLIPLKNQAKSACINSFSSLLTGLETFFTNIQKRINQQRNYLKVLEKMQGEPTSMDELVQEIISDDIEGLIYKETTKLPLKKIEQDIQDKRLQRLEASTEESSINDIVFIDKFKPSIYKPQEYIEKIPIKTLDNQKILYMRPLEKNQSEWNHMLKACVHYSQKFSGVLGKIQAEDRRNKLKSIRNQLKSEKFWQKPDISKPEISQKLFYIRNDEEDIQRPKTANNIDRGNHDIKVIRNMKGKEEIGIDKGKNYIEKFNIERKNIGFMKQRSLSPKGFRISNMKVKVLIGYEGVKRRGSDGDAEVESGKENKKGRLRDIYLRDFKNKY